MHGLALLLRDHHRCIIQISGCDRCDTGGFGRRIAIDQSNTVDYNRGYLLLIYGSRFTMLFLLVEPDYAHVVDAMWLCDGAMLPSPHRIASSSIASPHRPSHRPIASPHRPSHRLIVHRIASSSIASPHRQSRRRNASVGLLGHHM